MWMGGGWIVDLESHKGYQLHLVQMASAKVNMVMSMCMPQRHMQECHHTHMSGQLHAPIALALVIVTKLQAGCLRNQFDSWKGQEIRLFSKLARLSMSPM